MNFNMIITNNTSHSSISIVFELLRAYIRSQITCTHLYEQITHTNQFTYPTHRTWVITSHDIQPESQSIYIKEYYQVDDEFSRWYLPRGSLFSGVYLWRQADELQQRGDICRALRPLLHCLLVINRHPRVTFEKKSMQQKY